MGMDEITSAMSFPTGTQVTLTAFVQHLAEGIALADRKRPVAPVSRTGNQYQAGIGPHSESLTLDLAFAAMEEAGAPLALEREVSYPNVKRANCDVVIAGQWAIEVKLLRLLGDNAKQNPNILMHILSPYPQDRSALTDCDKLLRSGFNERKAVVIFGYDYPDWPLMDAVAAFETLASAKYELTPKVLAEFRCAAHPVHNHGAVVGWEVKGYRNL